MTSHYYSETPEKESTEHEIEISFRDKRYHFISDNSVFSKNKLDHGSKILLETVIDELQGNVLDFGCGYGPIGIIIREERGLDVTMSDVNERAVSLAVKNAKLNGKKVHVKKSDGFTNVEGTFGSILMNPPIRIGKERIYSFFKEAKDYLQEGGSLYIVIQKKQGAKSALSYLETIYSDVKTLNREAGYHIYKCTP